MFESTETTKTDAELEARLRQSFGRLRDRAPDELGLPGQDTGDEAGDIREPSLPAKLFIGPNATWYDDRWRWMDWRGRRRSWNWAAASTFGTWFGYRRMYPWLAVYGVLVLIASALLVLGTPPLVPLGLLVAASLLAGLYGNHLYLEHFRRTAGQIAERHDHHEAQVQAITEAGGVDRRMIWLWPAILVAVGLIVGVAAALSGLGAAEAG